MSTIIYYAANINMGETSDSDCDKFRAWAEAEIKSEYPGYDVEVINEDALTSARTDDMYNEDGIIDFCSRLWDRCPWDFA